MKMRSLIQHYDRRKSVHGDMSPSLGPKIVQLMHIFGQLPADVGGVEIAEHCRRAMPGVKPGTIARVLVQIRAVLRAAEGDGLIARAPRIPMPAVHDAREQQVSVAEAKLLVAHLEWACPRLHPLAMILLHSGCRLSEALRLRPQDIGEHGLRFSKPAAKRTKTVSRTVPTTPDLRKLICQGGVASYITGLRGALEIDATSCYDAGKSVSSSLGRAIKEGCEALGLPPIRVHDLRHCFAAMVAENGGDLSDIASLLGHSNINTTMIYRGLVKSKAVAIMSATKEFACKAI